MYPVPPNGMLSGEPKGVIADFSCFNRAKASLAASCSSVPLLSLSESLSRDESEWKPLLRKTSRIASVTVFEMHALKIAHNVPMFKSSSSSSSSSSSP